MDAPEYPACDGGPVRQPDAEPIARQAGDRTITINVALPYSDADQAILLRLDALQHTVLELQHVVSELSLRLRARMAKARLPDRDPEA